MTTLKQIGSYLWTIIGIILISATPSLFKGVSLDIFGYFSQIINLIKYVIHPEKLQYINPISHLKRQVFPYLFGPYIYSLEIVFGAIIISIVLALLLATSIAFFKKKTRDKLKGILFVFESLPDIFIILTIQFLIVFIFQKTGVRLMQFVQFGDERVYTLPIIVMSILPTVYLIKIMLTNFEEEMDELYVEFAVSKGLSKEKIIIIHILRNTLISGFYHSKTIIWMLMSNLLMVEYFFNMNGITWFILEYYQPIILMIGLILLYTPLFIFQTILTLIVKKITGKKEELI